ncbi:MAG: transposase [Anaerolineae bacterium]|nr:transposase [Anaerolineae bacterium]
MTKPTPLEFNQYYHIYNRGNNRENLFRKPDNYHYFLKLYTKHISPITDTFAYCLLPNHFHLLVRIKSPDEQDLTSFQNLSGLKPRNPSQQFSNFFNAYTKAINKAYNRTGALFQRPFGRIPVTSDAYFVQLVIYIHQNPQKHGLIDDFREWPYSSYRALFSDKPTRLKRDIVLNWFDGPRQMERLHRRGVNEAQLEPLIFEDFD